ncbi:MAG: hypothetical protein JW902_15515 [Syntrophaceae bacterium]|nr:hypothetical protein [Syntrophaceae bacterium]
MKTKKQCWLTRVPRVCIALALTGIVLAIKWGVTETFSSVSRYGNLVDNIWYYLIPTIMFTAGAIQRWNWRHVLIMLLFGGGAVGVNFLLTFIGIPPEKGYHPYFCLTYFLILIWFLGIGEAVTTGRRRWTTFLWLLPVVIAISAFHLMAYHFVLWLKCYKDIDFFHDIIRIFMPTALAWIAIPFVLNDKFQTRHCRIVLLGVCTTCLILFSVFVNYLVFHLARTSLSGQGIFSQRSSVYLLRDRGKPEDYECILNALLASDLHAPIDMKWLDWRAAAIAVLAEKREYAGRTADALMSRLREKRSYPLADLTVKILAQENKYEAVPILLRYALVYGNYEFSEALEEMKVPEVGYCVLKNILEFDRPRSRPEDFVVSQEHREQLSSIIGEKIGPMYSDCLKALAEMTERDHSNLPPNIQKEVTREFWCYMKYGNVLYDSTQARNELAIRRLKANGLLDKLQLVIQTNKNFGDERYIPDWRIPPDAFEACKVIVPVFTQAEKDLEVKEPNFDAPTIDAFEREIEVFVERKKKMIQDYLSSPTTQNSK